REPKGVVVVSPRPRLLPGGDYGCIRGSERGRVWGGADCNANAGLRAACIDCGVCDDRADNDHLGTPCKPRPATGIAWLGGNSRSWRSTQLSALGWGSISSICSTRLH